MHLEPGTQIDGKDYVYTIVRTLGHGTSGITYLVQSRLKADPQAGVRTMALKEYFVKGVNGRQHRMVTYPADNAMHERMRLRFMEEARNLGDFNSAGIVTVYEAFDANNTSYFSMDYIAGGDLEAYIHSHGAPLPVATIKSFASQLARALGIVHRHGMLHLDVRPSNVMMRDDEQIVLIDFGFSKRFGAEGSGAAPYTEGHETDAYHPLELQTYSSTYSDRLPATLDVYSLAATVYKMATGRDPLPPAALSEQFPYSLLEKAGASDALIALLHKGLARRPKDRIQDMDEFLQMVQALPESSQAAAPSKVEAPKTKPKAPQPPHPPKSGKKWGWIALTAVAVIILPVLVGIFAGIRSIPEKAETANEAVSGKSVQDFLYTNYEGVRFRYSGDIDSTLSVPIPHGIGTGVYASGTYIGEYRHGLRHGHGVFDSADGQNHYDGAFFNDLYSTGRLSLPDGRWYYGTFIDGQPYNGKWYNEDNTVYCEIKEGK